MSRQAEYAARYCGPEKGRISTTTWSRALLEKTIAAQPTVKRIILVMRMNNRIQHFFVK
jgi:hypothetical protein